MTPDPEEKPVASVDPLATGSLEDVADGREGLAQAIRLCISSPLPMMVWWPERREPLCNPAWEELPRSGPTDLRDRIWQAVLADVQAVMRTGQALICDVSSHIGPDLPPAAGSTCCLHPLLDEDGLAIGVLVIGSLCDPQPRVGWREQMNYATIIESMDLGFCRVKVIDSEADELLDYVFLEVNAAYEIHTGLSHLVGRRVSEVVTEREPFWSEAIRGVLASGAVLQTMLSLSKGQRTFEVCIMRIGGPGSREAVMLVKNITIQTQATRLLKLSEEQARKAAALARAESSRLSAVLDASPAAVIVVDADNRITLVNTQARQAWGDMPQAGSIAWVGHWADGSPRHGQRLRPSQWPLSRALLGHSSREIIDITSPRDGRSRRTFLCSASPIWDLNLHIEGAVVVAMDITDRVEAEKALRSANLHKDEFLAMLGHELRNPLAPIAMAAELIGQLWASPESMRETSEIIARQVAHMRGLIDDLLDTARVSQGLIRLDLSSHSLQALIADAAEQTQDLLQQMGHRLELDLPQRPLQLQADGKRMVQIMTNLLHNAAKYTPAMGLIELRVWTDPDTVFIEVADNGIGMSPEMLQRAFDLFSQAERSMDRQQGGLGLGLPLVKRLVELHGGRIYADSAGPGQGSRFTVQLPLTQASAAQEPQALRRLSPETAQALHILLVDDNVDAVQTLALYLQACGHECQIAHTGEQALELSRARLPHVFILDIGLPGMDGRELARRLRSQPEPAPSMIVALSGYAQADEQQKALDAGFDHYLVKPVDVDRLTELLQSLAERRVPPDRH